MKAGLVAALVSGVPSTAYNVARGRDPFEAAKAAGTLLVPETSSPSALVAAAVPVHFAISLAWAAVLGRTLPGRNRVAWGAAAGLAIAAFDLGVVARRYPAIRALPTLPQLADHVLFGATVAWVGRRRA